MFDCSSPRPGCSCKTTLAILRPCLVARKRCGSFGDGAKRLAVGVRQGFVSDVQEGEKKEAIEPDDILTI